MKPVYSIVIPVFNEIEVLDTLYSRMTTMLEKLNEPWEIILIDDGSSDGSSETMRNLSERDPRIRPTPTLFGKRRSRESICYPYLPQQRGF